MYLLSIGLLSIFSGEHMLTISSAEMKSYYSFYSPKLMYDGSTESYALSRHETDGMWARVNLEQYSVIRKIEIYNVDRGQCCQQRLLGMSVYINESGWNIKSCGTITSLRDKYVFNCFGAGHAIEMREEGEVQQWNIAEVRVYGTEYVWPTTESSDRS